MLLNSSQLHLEEGEFLQQRAPGKNRTHDQDPPSSSLDRYFFRCRVTVQATVSLYYTLGSL